MSAVSAVVAAGGEGAARLLERVEERMAELSAGYGPLLGDHASATIAAGGKRLRPLLVALAAGVPAPPDDALVRAAVAVELIHSATLVHDDVLDRSPLRRGRPTVYALAGRRTATAVGDLLFSRAFAELSAPAAFGVTRASEATLQIARESVRVLALASRALADGELMQREDLHRVDVSIERYLERCRLKTGVLFRAACELGALVGGGPRARLAEFGERIGIAFQLLDDVLDVSGPPERTGKPRGTDLLDGTVTLPLIVARSRDAELAALDLRGITGAQAAAVCERIAATGALDVARERALALVAEAKAGLEALTAPQRAALELAADGVVERYS